MSNLNLKKKIYIYELPYTERKEFCNIIDMNDKWEELGGKYMKIDPATLFRIGKAPMRNKSSTDELLTLWGEQNHTILELFTILYEMQHYQAMIILKSFVEDKYHKLIYQGDKSFSNLVWKTNMKTGNNLHNEDEDLIKLNTDNNQGSVNKLEHKDLNTLGKINEQTYSDPMFSSAEACTPLITYNELEQATNYWNEDNILGKGGFGVVFKGKWKNTEVAIKRLETQKGADQQFNILEAQRQSLRELKYLNSCRHDNILSLYGFSIGGEKPCLVYRYMINGSLEDRLQCRKDTKPLTWEIRFKIATGSARGLQFLHGMDKPLIHGDMKSANILLDPCFEPHIGDFGLAREGPLQEYTRVKVVHGTMPYLPDEFLRGKKFSTKVDTYSFGVVLFEIATGQKAYDKFRNHKFLKDHVENADCPISDMADPKAGPDEKNIYSSLMSIGKNCVNYIARYRPEMEQVLRKLDCVMLQDNLLFVPVNSPVPSNQLLKKNSSNLQIEKKNYCKVSSNPGSTRSTFASPSINKSVSSDSQLTNNRTGDSTSTSKFAESGTVEKKNSARNNPIPGECEELPLISALQMNNP